MRKTVAVINFTLDGVSDHSAGLADSELHEHYTQLLRESDVILYGHTTYRLMEYWREVLQNPVSDPSMNSFAQAIDQIPKVVFSRTVKEFADRWTSARISSQKLEDEVKFLKQSAGKSILVGSPDLIIQLLNLNLIDECQFCIHPVLTAGGTRLFDGIRQRIRMNLLRTKTFKNGAVILYYKPVNQAR